LGLTIRQSKRASLGMTMNLKACYYNCKLEIQKQKQLLSIGLTELIAIHGGSNHEQIDIYYHKKTATYYNLLKRMVINSLHLLYAEKSIYTNLIGKTGDLKVLLATYDRYVKISLDIVDEAIEEDMFTDGEYVFLCDKVLTHYNGVKAMCMFQRLKL